MLPEPQQAFLPETVPGVAVGAPIAPSMDLNAVYPQQAASPATALTAHNSAMQQSHSLADHANEVAEIEHLLSVYEQQRAAHARAGRVAELAKWEARNLPQVHVLAQRIAYLSQLGCSTSCSSY